MYAAIRKLRASHGASILEILVALAIMGVVTTAVLRTYVTQHKNYMIQDDISNVQQAARASLDQLAKHVRMAGYEVPNTLKGIVAGNANPDTIVVTFLATGCQTFLSTAQTGVSGQLDCGNSVSCFYDNQWLYIYEPDSGKGEWFQLGHVDSATNILSPATALSRSYGAKSVVLGLTQATFYVDNTTSPDHPTLMLQYRGQPAVVYADDIVDLQLKYRMLGGAIVDEPVLLDKIKEVLIEITSRSLNPDPEADNDHKYRLRTYSTGINPRNIHSIS